MRPAIHQAEDTGHVHYDLVQTIFQGSNVIITAVGGYKQQIIRRAMAMDDPFAALHADFGAIRAPLLNNYRSFPELVRTQHVLARALDAHAAQPVSKSETTSDSAWQRSFRVRVRQRVPTGDPKQPRGIEPLQDAAELRIELHRRNPGRGAGGISIWTLAFDPQPTYNAHRSTTASLPERTSAPVSVGKAATN